MNFPTVVWFQNDLRVEDHPALTAAIKRGEPIIPVFIWSPQEDAPWQPGAASRWWLHQSLTRLNEQLNRLGSRLTIRHGHTLTELLAVIKETGAVSVYWSRRYEPAAVERENQIARELHHRQIEAQCFSGQLLFEPEQIRTKEGKPYQVFTAFWKACLAQTELDEPLAAPTELHSPSTWPKSLEIAALKLEPRIRWDLGMCDAWTPGCDTAKSEFTKFLSSSVEDYAQSRDLPSERGTSRMSPHLHFGEISPRTIWHEVRQIADRGRLKADSVGIETFLKEVGWRDFAYHLLVHFPTTPQQPLRPEFARFPWKKSTEQLEAWQRGQTGYPIVDAGMRELWTTGWMHNRVRMIVASFLVKDLLISWQEGAAWFWDTLVDADLASNTLGWQWSGGCGADAAPYFRIFNPVLQSRKFDVEGKYIRRWLPELQKLSNDSLHSPWTAPADELRRVDIRMGATYPLPVVDHALARQEALAALQKLKT